MDFLIQAEKTIAGIPEWKRTDYAGQYRWRAPTAIDGKPTDMELVVDAYPDEEDLKFTINLLYMKSVYRLDYGKNERHRNHSVKKTLTPVGLKMGFIYGSHIHPWEMNRLLATHSTLPDTLEFATPLPDNVRHFDHALRLFCTKTNIFISQGLMPSLPNREFLL